MRTNNKNTATSIFNVPVGFYQTVSDNRGKTANLLNILLDIKNGRYRTHIEQLRGIAESGTYKTERKSILPAFTPSATFQETRKNEHLQAHSGFIVVDFDDVPYIEEFRYKLCHDLHSAAVFYSTSNKGVKVLCRVEEITTHKEHETAFLQVADYYAQRYGVPYDLTGRDVARCCFVSWDSALFTNEGAKIFSVEKRKPDTPKPIPTATAPVKPVSESHTRKIAFRVMENAARAIATAPRGTRHDTRLRQIQLVGGYVQHGGLERSEVCEYLLPVVLEHTDSPKQTEHDFHEFLEHGMKHPIDLAHEAQKQRDFAAKHAANGADGHKKSPPPPVTETGDEQQIHRDENTEKAAEKQAENAAKQNKKQAKNGVKPKKQKNIEYIESWLEGKYQFRNNLIIGSIQYTEQSRNDWRNIDDYTVATLWRSMQHDDVKCTEGQLLRILKSDFCEPYNPFTTYFKSLPQWDGKPHIQHYASLVTVDDEEKEAWQMYFRRWMIALVANALQRGINTACLTLSGGQNLGKTTFFENIVPAELRAHYENTTVDFDSVGKDGEFKLASNLLIQLDEMQSASRKETNTLKSLMTRKEINARRPYDRLPRILPRYASFCGTTNNSTFLSDVTGSRRFLCVEAKHIQWAQPTERDRAQIYAEALHYLNSGEKYSFTLNEVATLEHSNAKYKIVLPEMEALMSVFEPAEKDGGEYLTCVEILEELHRKFPTQKFGSKTLGIVLQNCGFLRVQKKIHNIPAYRYVVKRIL